MTELWSKLHDLFDTDDGSLPDIYILNLSEQGVKDIWAYLRQSAAGYAGDAFFWHTARQEEVPIDDVPNAAELVISGEAKVFMRCCVASPSAGRSSPIWEILRSSPTPYTWTIAWGRNGGQLS